MLIVEKLNGERYELSEENTGLKLIDFTIDAPNMITETESIPGLDGHIDLGSQFAGRTMSASFKVFARDRYDYPLVRNLIFNIFESRQPFRLIDDREPGKRWLVKYSGTYSIRQLIATFGEFDIGFISDSAYCESIGTSLAPLTFDSELWQFGQGLTMDEVSYVHKTNVFDIYNAGDVEVVPRKMYLKIEYKGTSNNLKIKNETNGDEWTYNGTSNSGDTIKLEGVRSFKNNLSITPNTNFNLIKLVPGLNRIRLTGASGSYEIKFDFRFYYL